MQPSPSTMSAPDLFLSQTTAKLVLPNRPAALTQLSEWLQTVARASGLSARCAFHLELVLTETVTNIIDHAYVANSPGVITLLIACEPGRVVAQVEDDGRPFDPTAAPVHTQPASLEQATIGGLGIHMMRSYTQQWEYRRIDQRNQLRMTITCDA